MRTLGVIPSQYQPVVLNKNKRYGKPLAQLHKEILTSFNVDSPDAKRLSQHFDSTKDWTKSQSGLHDDKYTQKACAENVKSAADIKRRQVRNSIKDTRKVNWNYKYDAEPSTILQRLLQTKLMAEKYFSSQKQQFSKSRGVQKLLELFSERQPSLAKVAQSHLKNMQRVPGILTPIYLYLMVCKIYLDEKICVGMGERNTSILYDKLNYSLEVLTSKTSEELISSPSGRMTFAKLKEKLNHLDENFKQTLKAEREAYYQLDLLYTSKVYRKFYLNRSGI